MDGMTEQTTCRVCHALNASHRQYCWNCAAEVPPPKLESYHRSNRKAMEWAGSDEPKEPREL